MSFPADLRPLAPVLLAVVVAAVGCSDEPPAVEVGEGRMPASAPAGFPVPAGAEIGATMVDHDNSVTEVAITSTMEVDQLIAYYRPNLHCRRTWMPIFFHGLDVVRLNAYIVCK